MLRLEWCGCDPDNATEYQWLCEQRHNTALEEEMARELCERLAAESDQWKHHNELAYLERDVAWLKRRENQLKHQIKYYKKRSRTLWEISYNCAQAAMKRAPLADNEIYIGGPPPGWEKYYKFRSQWTKSKIRLCELEEQLKDIKYQRRTVEVQKWYRKFTDFFDI